jgi:hypothetical protein
VTEEEGGRRRARLAPEAVQRRPRPSADSRADGRRSGRHHHHHKHLELPSKQSAASATNSVLRRRRRMTTECPARSPALPVFHAPQGLPACLSICGLTSRWAIVVISICVGGAAAACNRATTSSTSGRVCANSESEVRRGRRWRIILRGQRQGRVAVRYAWVFALPSRTGYRVQHVASRGPQ